MQAFIEITHPLATARGTVTLCAVSVSSVPLWLTSPSFVLKDKSSGVSGQRRAALDCFAGPVLQSGRRGTLSAHQRADFKEVCRLMSEHGKCPMGNHPW